MVKLPDELAQRAKSAGLLTDSGIQRLLEEAMRREAGQRLLQVAQRLQAAGVEPMSEDEIVAEVKAARAERRAHEAQGINPQQPKQSRSHSHRLWRASRLTLCTRHVTMLPWQSRASSAKTPKPSLKAGGCAAG